MSALRERRVRIGPHDLLLKTPERISAFAVERRHVYVEDAKEAVRLVLLACRLPQGCPRHPLSDAEILQPLFES